MIWYFNENLNKIIIYFTWYRCSQLFTQFSIVRCGNTLYILLKTFNEKCSNNEKQIHMFVELPYMVILSLHPEMLISTKGLSKKKKQFYLQT